MTESAFIKKFTYLIRKAVMLNKKAWKYGILSMEDELEDLDDEDFKIAMRKVVDGFDAAIIDEILSNKIAFEKDKHSRQYMTMLKRAVLGIHARLKTDILIQVLLSYANLPQKEQDKLEDELLKDIPDESDEPEASSQEQTNHSISRVSGGVNRSQTKFGTVNVIIDDDPGLVSAIKDQSFVFDDIVRLSDHAILRIMRETDTHDLAVALKAASKEAQGKIFKNLSKRAGAMIREEMDYMGPVLASDVEKARQKIISIIRLLEDSGEIVVG